MKRGIEKLQKEIEDRHAQTKVYLEHNRIHQKIEGSLKVVNKKILELQQKIMEMNKHSKEMHKIVEDTKKLVEMEKQKMKEI